MEATDSRVEADMEAFEQCVGCKTVAPAPKATSRRKKSGLTRGLCKKCYGRANYKGTLNDIALPPNMTAPHEVGTTRKTTDGYVQIKTERGWIMEHRHAMEIHLGRQLVPGENVHHINGVRDDNRLENLELWAAAQPYGQRVQQLIPYMVKYHREAILEALKDAA